MGYTHYWYRPQTLPPAKFTAFKNDCKKIIDYCHNEMGLHLAGGSGEGEPLLTDESVIFNGSDSQPIGIWTTSDHVGLAWPSDDAGILEHSNNPTENKISGQWFAGNLLVQRTAPINNLTGLGSGSYETFYIDREETQPDHRQDKPLVFNCAKTNFRPYDLTITACLIAFKYHFGNTITVVTDGHEKDWIDGRILCNNVLGYGLEVDIFAEATTLPEPPPKVKEPEKEDKPCKEIAKEIKLHISKLFPKVKLSIVTSYSHIDLYILESNQDILLDYKVNGRNINQYYYKTDENITPHGKEVIDAIHSIILKYHWDKSDSQSDYFHCAFYYNYNVGKWDKPFKLVPPPQVTEVATQPIIADIQLIDYSDKAIAVIGNTKPIKAMLKSLGGRFNAFLTCGPGWIFSKTKYNELLTLTTQ
jgi:hypothetical protein